MGKNNEDPEYAIMYDINGRMYPPSTAKKTKKVLDGIEFDAIETNRGTFIYDTDIYTDLVGGGKCYTLCNTTTKTGSKVILPAKYKTMTFEPSDIIKNVCRHIETKKLECEVKGETKKAEKFGKISKKLLKNEISRKKLFALMKGKLRGEKDEIIDIGYKPIPTVLIPPKAPMIEGLGKCRVAAVDIQSTISQFLRTIQNIKVDHNPADYKGGLQAEQLKSIGKWVVMFLIVGYMVTQIDLGSIF